MPFYVYIMASGRNGTLYTGVTNNLTRRVEEHRKGQGSKFVTKHDVLNLVYAEEFGDVAEAIEHEKRVKKWRRRWKLSLIENSNPDWEDLTRHVT